MGTAFIGRQYELTLLNRLLSNEQASFVVVNGRRRIGKSRLIAEFAKPYLFYRFTGLAPFKGSTAQDQRDEFTRQFREYFDLPIPGLQDWGDLFTLLAKQTHRGRVVILFDEISWMADNDPSFLSKLKNAWDNHFTKNSKLILFLCGSVSTWIEENLLSNTAFLGRPTLHLTVEELPLSECIQFWDKAQDTISFFEKLKFLCVTGGVPRYLELMNQHETAENNIRHLFFDKSSALYDEFQKIFNDIYGRKSATYKGIIDHLVTGPANQDEIVEKMGIARSGDISEYLDALILGGFVARDYTWQPKTGKVSNLSRYRLKDNYLRFALRYILPNMPLIEKRRFENRSIVTLPGWDTIMGLQFENLILNNHKQVIQNLNIREEDIIFDNPFFQRHTTRSPGCQIDYMIQTRHDTVYVCEIKFKHEKIGATIIDEMKEKCKRLLVPRNTSKRPVLIHANGVTSSVEESGFFYKILDIQDLL